MIINHGTLRTLGTTFSGLFNRGKERARTQRSLVSTPVPSSTKENEYGWLGDLPGMREWLGDRVINQMAANAYTIRNRKWEQTIAVQADDIRDDNTGVYSLRFELMGTAAAAHPEQLVFQTLKAGFATNCYDGQYFFDTDHPVLDENGAVTSVANTDGGSGAPWFLIDNTRGVLPIILQEREPLSFAALDNLDDPRVFMSDEFVYGSRARYNAGYGFWQFCWGSKQPLTPANYGAARAALGNMKGDYGRPLGVMGTLLVVPPSLESAGLKILNNELGSGGESNEWKGTAKLEVVPWLA